MSELTTIYPLCYEVRLSADNWDRLTKLARLYGLTTQVCIRQLIDQDWDRRRLLIEYMEENR